MTDAQLANRRTLAVTLQERLKHARHLLEYVGLRIVAAVFSSLPVDRVSAFSGFMWRHIAPWQHRHRRALANLARAYPEKTLAERETIARDMWENLGRTFAEAFQLEAIAKSDRVRIEQPEIFAAVAASGRGAVFCSAHIGNWEVSTVPGLRHGLRTASVYQAVKNPWFERFLLDARRFLYTGGLHPKDKNAARAMVRHAKGGGSVAVMTDLRDWTGVKIDFFGTLAPTTQFPANLAHLLDVPLFVGTAIRERGARFRIVVEPVLVRQSGDREADVLAMTRDIHAIIERAIRAQPAQWMWGHRRWG